MLEKGASIKVYNENYDEPSDFICQYSGEKKATAHALLLRGKPIPAEANAIRSVR